MRIFFVFALIMYSSLQAQNLKREADWGFKWAVNENGTVTAKNIIQTSPAARAGLKQDDLIIQVNDVEVKSAMDIQQVTKWIRGGDLVKLTIDRKKKKTSISFRLNPKPLESYDGIQVSYGEVETSQGYSIRTITTMPKSTSGKLPGIFFVSWLSCDPVEINPANMDGWAQLIRDFATRSGMVFMRPEKPGLGDSQGPDCSVCDLNQDMQAFRAAFKQFKKNPYVDSTRIFVFGGSIGGALAPVLMQEENLKGIIVANTFGRTWFEHFMDFERTRLQLIGKSFAEVNDQMKLFSEFYTDYLIAKRTPKQIIESKPYLKEVWYDEPESQFGRPSAYHHQVQELNVPGAWQRINYPALVIYGELDWIMSKQEHDYIVNVVNTTHPGHAELRIIKGMDHHFSIYNSLNESFEASSVNYAKDVFPFIKQWIDQRLKE